MQQAQTASPRSSGAKHDWVSPGDRYRQPKADALDGMEALLAYLICGDELETTDQSGTVAVMGEIEAEQIDSGKRLQFVPMTPKRCYTFDAVDRGRVFTHNPDLLLSTVQDLLGSSAETAFFFEGGVRWTGYRRLHKAPRGVWVAQRGASLYEVHFREIFSDGRSRYFRRVAAVSKSGQPVAAVIIGSAGADAVKDGRCAVMAASLIEDAHRPMALTATVTDAASVIFPVEMGEHRELFALRDAPLTPAGRRKAILHWVTSHTRKSIKADSIVRAHWRGVREMSVDGLRVQLASNEGVAA